MQIYSVYHIGVVDVWDWRAGENTQSRVNTPCFNGISRHSTGFDECFLRQVINRTSAWRSKQKHEQLCQLFSNNHSNPAERRETKHKFSQTSTSILYAIQTSGTPLFLKGMFLLLIFWYRIGAEWQHQQSRLSSAISKSAVKFEVNV